MNFDGWEQPEGWTLARLTDVADVIMGQSPPGSTYNTASQGLPFFQGKAEFGTDHPTVRKWCVAPTRIAEPGDILMSVRAPVGSTNVADRRCAIGRGLAAIRTKPGIPPSLVRHAIRLQEDEIASWGTGSTFTAITKEAFNKIRIPLPPTNAREPLAALLDQCVVLVRSSKTHLALGGRLIERSRQAILSAACSGRLTADWRVSNAPTATASELIRTLPEEASRRKSESTNDAPDIELPATWTWARLSRLAQSVEYGYTASSTREPVGPKILRITDIQDERVDWSAVPYCTISSDKKEQFRLRAGDLVFARTGATTGKSYLLQDEPPEAVFASYLIRVRLHEGISPAFIYAFFRSLMYWQQIVDASIGTGQPNVNGTKLAGLWIPVPPADEQGEIVERVDRIFAIAGGLIGRAQAASQQIDRTSQAVAAKAFRGDLQLAGKSRVRSMSRG